MEPVEKPAEVPVHVPVALKQAVREIEAHASSMGWDQPASLFALVETTELLSAEPALAAQLGVEPGEGLTPVLQELPEDEALEATLEQIEWPAQVFGCAAVIERLVLPPSADGQVPDDSAAALEYAATHPDRHEVRMVAAATRDGATYCALRLRTHDDDFAVIEGVDLVPALLELVKGTLAG
jgi:hypothetical protein